MLEQVVVGLALVTSSRVSSTDLEATMPPTLSVHLTKHNLMRNHREHMVLPTAPSRTVTEPVRADYCDSGSQSFVPVAKRCGSTCSNCNKAVYLRSAPLGAIRAARRCELRVVTRGSECRLLTLSHNQRTRFLPTAPPSSPLPSLLSPPHTLLFPFPSLPFPSLPFFLSSFSLLRSYVRTYVLDFFLSSFFFISSSVTHTPLHPTTTPPPTPPHPPPPLASTPHHPTTPPPLHHPPPPPHHHPTTPPHPTPPRRQSRARPF